MNKENFLEELARQLHRLQQEERERFLTYYDEIIEDYKENGMSEEEAVAKAGDPEQIAREIMEEKDTFTVRIPSTGNRIVNSTLLILGFPLWGSLLAVAVLAALCIALMALCLYVAMWCVPLSLGMMSVVPFIVAIVSIIGSPIVIAGNLGLGIMQFGAAVLMIGISGICSILTIRTTKYIIRLTKSITPWVVELGKGRKIKS